jgi:hypothetical protein
MNFRDSLRQIFPILLALQVCVASAADNDGVRFTGVDDGQTGVFEIEGPWLLDWSTSSETPLAAVFQMRLHDGGTGEFLGNIIELHGTGRGLKLFEEGGEFQIEVVASGVMWELDIANINEDQAAELKRSPEQRPTLKHSARLKLRLVREGTFNEWRPEGNNILLLFDNDELRWRANFAQPCPGLETATAISFVTSAAGSLEDYDSILLDDGTRCYFDRVIPATIGR